MKRGSSVEIPCEMAKQLLLQHLAEVEGVPLLDLLNMASVHFLDAEDREVALDSIAITWEKTT